MITKDQRFYSQEAGLTILEIMFGLAILTIVALSISHFSTQTAKSDAELSARLMVKSQLIQLTGFVDNDLSFRDRAAIEPICLTALCTNFTIKRYTSTGVIYHVNYSSTCRTFPSGMGKVAEISFLASALNVAGNPIRSQCMAVLNCPSDKYPAVEITTTNVPGGVNVPNYPAVTPNLSASQSAARSIVGAAICARQTVINALVTPNYLQDHITVEGASMSSEADGNGVRSLRIDRKETDFTSSNVARIQMMPRPIP